MKHLLIICSLLLTSVCWSEDVNYKDLIIGDGLYYEKHTDKPFTGISTGRKRGKIIDGKREGEWLIYHEQNGQLLHKEYFKDGKPEGEWITYHYNGQLWLRTNFKDGKLEGNQLWYGENGQLEKTKIYKEGVLIETIKH